MKNDFENLYEYLYEYVETSEDKIKSAQDIAHIARVLLMEQELINEKSELGKQS